MTQTRIHWLVVNSASGSNSAEAVQALEEAFARAGTAVSTVVDIQTDPAPDKAALEAAGVDLLSIFAGDGTVGSLVAAVEGWAGAVLVLPGGTANLLARALHGEREAVEIAAALGSLTPIRRHSIRCSQGVGLIEVLAGPGAAWSDVREGLREGDIAEVAATGVEAVRQSIAGPMVRLHEPSLGRETGYAGIRLVPEDSMMAVSGYGAETFGDYLLQGVALLKRDYREGPHEQLGRHAEVVCCTMEGEEIALMIDGERHSGGREECFSLAELAVNLLATRG